VLVPVLTDKDVYALTAGAPEDAAHLSIHDSLAMDPGKLAVQIAVLKAAREFNLTRLISFHSRFPDARAWSRTLQHANALLPEDERLPAVTGLHISGQHKPAQRTAVYNRLKSNDTGLVVVSNAKVMGEGVNVPNVDGVVFVDPKSSFEAVVQAVGRALRTNGDRHKIATIIVPILLAEGGKKPPSFDEWITIATAYKAATGDTDPRSDQLFTYEGHEYKVGNWWSNRRYGYLNGKCSQEQRQKLEAVGLRLTPSRSRPRKN
jgi:superfamily II DNA or RNA helicase